MQKIYFVRAEWDEEAKVWVATSDDVPGLVTEAETMEALSSKLEVMIPELLAENGYPDINKISYEVLARKFSVTQAISINKSMGTSFTPELIRLLTASGCYFERHGKGDHDI
jgi:predicted RNase H-like HicB family nuclease